MEREIAVVVVEAEERARASVRDALTARGMRVITASSADDAHRLLSAGAPCDALVLASGIDRAAVLGRYRQGGGKAPAVLVGEERADASAFEGVIAFVARGDEGELPRAVTRVVEAARSVPGREARDPDEGRVSASAAMQRIFERGGRGADADGPVLIRGEAGVGKEVVARSIHAESRRRTRAFVKINCAALPSELLESELFGHEKGAFTGAHQEKPGKFELADGGTIFLDELGEMHPSLQAKLLQVLQDEEFYRVGGKKPIRVDARVVVATNRVLEEEIERGGFREDLYYRLNVVSIRVPSLRERKEDVAPLV